MSNVVGALEVSPSSFLDLLYRFQIRTQTMTFLRQELGLHVKTGPFDFGIDYAFLDGSINDGSLLGRQQEFNTVARAKINENWSLFVSGREDLETNQALEYGGGVTYQNECITLQLVAARSNYSTTELTPETRVLLVINFKNLGGSNLAL